MCRGVARGGSGGDGGPALKKKVEVVPCELCGRRAMLYCQADGAYLCRECDRHVHGANFLAGRHIRCLLCNHCRKLTRRYVVGNSTETVCPAAVNWAQMRRLGDRNECLRETANTPFLFL